MKNSWDAIIRDGLPPWARPGRHCNNNSVFSQPSDISNHFHSSALFVSDGIKIGEKLGRCDLILTLLSGVLIMRLQHFRHCRQFSPFLNCVLSGLYLLLSLASFDSLKLRYDCHSLSSRNQHLCHWKGICGMLIAPCCSDTSRVKLDPATILLSKLVNCA